MIDGFEKAFVSCESKQTHLSGCRLFVSDYLFTMKCDHERRAHKGLKLDLL